jgi:hypothetical protein
MKILILLAISFTALMLLIHVSTWKLFQKWSDPNGAWIKEKFSPQRALRVEALYWLLCLGSWTLWPSSAWKAMVVVLAGIHLGVWAASELHVVPVSALQTQSRKARRFIVAFDLAEALALLAILWLVIAHGFYTGQHFRGL